MVRDDGGIVHGCACASKKINLGAGREAAYGAGFAEELYVEAHALA